MKLSAVSVTRFSSLNLLSRSLVIGAVALASVLTCGAHFALAASEKIVPYKDVLFANPAILETKGDFTSYEYREGRDVNGRDEIPVKKVRAQYTEPLRADQERRRKAYGVEVYEAGDAASAKFAVIFVHGAGGNGSLGFSDITFGGNFNRLKHLVVESGGVYLSPSIRGFNDSTQIEKILKDVNPAAKVILACGSRGGITCWSAYENPRLVPRLAGLVLLGAQPHSFNQRELGFVQRVPVFFAHGSRDPVFSARGVANQFAWLQQAGIKSKYALYNSGNHGTPIRMVNWSDVLNWAL